MCVSLIWDVFPPTMNLGQNSEATGGMARQMGGREYVMLNRWGGGGSEGAAAER